MSKKVRVDDDSITEAMREEYHVSWLMNSSGFAVRSMLTMYELFRALAVGDETNTTIKQRRRKKKKKCNKREEDEEEGMAAMAA